MIHVLHVVPRLHDGGPNESILAAHRMADEWGAPESASVLTLEPGGSTRLVMQAMRQRVRVHVAPTLEREDELLQAADVVVVHWWNTPSMWQFLARRRGQELRWVLSAEVNGQTRPQLLPAALGTASNHLVLTSPHCVDLRDDGEVSVIPAVVDGSPPPISQRAGPPHLVHVGTVNVMKLDPAIVDLHVPAARVGARMTIAGSGGDEDRFRDRAASLGVAEAVRFPGFVAAPAELLTDATAFTAPSSSVSYASCDKAVQRALLAGVPTLVPADSPIAWLVDDGVTGWHATGRERFADLAAAVATGDLILDRREVAAAAATRFAPMPGVRAWHEVLARVAQAAPRPVTPGAPTEDDWLEMQLGAPTREAAASLRQARRPSLDALIESAALLDQHARWSCEGGLAQFLAWVSTRGDGVPTPSGPVDSVETPG